MSRSISTDAKLLLSFCILSHKSPIVLTAKGFGSLGIFGISDRFPHELECWAGLECTVNRVGDAYYNQFDHTHAASYEDFIDHPQRPAISALRYLASWEIVSRDGQFWDRITTDLAALRKRHIRPVVGLIHHGSGPPETDLLSPDFAKGLASHARETARRFPWVKEWTPVNEPLTTARFSALYGLWYPHARNEESFWTALLNQIDATRLAMREIRSVNPDAVLVQTEDLGRTYATAFLKDQSGFDNTRRWMTWDLLDGRVGPDHPFWDRLTSMGFGDRLRAIADDPCPADVIGVNHYLTSDRFLDHRTYRYPAGNSGGNADVRYADIEALRVLLPPPAGLANALREAWQRYRKPVALTECHNACSREEQMRWTAEAWGGARRLRADGANIVAVTSWAVTGSRNWASLLTRDDGNYECGVFDSRGGSLRPTAMVPLLNEVSNGAAPDHPVASAPGWWKRNTRLVYPAVGMATHVDALEATNQPGPRRPLLIAGGTGTLGRAIADACRHRRLDFILTARDDMDVTDASAIDSALARFRPWAVINATGWVRVDDAESHKAECRAINVDGVAMLANACAGRDIHYTMFSSDLVFDGISETPYIETDPLMPLNVYGQSKADAEAVAANGLVIRTSAFFSPHDEHNFATAVHATLARQDVFTATDDYRVTPTYVPDLVEHVLDLVIDHEQGIWHLSNGEEVSWAEFARRIARACGLSDTLIKSVSGLDPHWTAPRPIRSGLHTIRGIRMPPLSDAIVRFAQHIR